MAILALAAAFIEPKPKDAATACPVEPEPELALEEGSVSQEHRRAPEGPHSAALTAPCSGPED